MNTEMMGVALRLAGLAQVGLVIANFVAAKRFGYARSLVGAEVIVRQIFYVHCGYIVFLIAALGALCLGWPELLLGDRMGKVVCFFFAVFWGSRVIVQLGYYDPEMRRVQRGWDVFFLCVFGGLAVIFLLGGIFGK